MTEERYRVVDESESGHCCFDYTVVDTHQPHPLYPNHFVGICECFEKEQADLVAAALNAAAVAPVSVQEPGEDVAELIPIHTQYNDLKLVVRVLVRDSEGRITRGCSLNGCHTLLADHKTGRFWFEGHETSLLHTCAYTGWKK